MLDADQGRVAEHLEAPQSFIRDRDIRECRGAVKRVPVEIYGLRQLARSLAVIVIVTEVLKWLHRVILRATAGRLVAEVVVGAPLRTGAPSALTEALAVLET